MCHRNLLRLEPYHCGFRIVNFVQRGEADRTNSTAEIEKPRGVRHRVRCPPRANNVVERETMALLELKHVPRAAQTIQTLVCLHCNISGELLLLLLPGWRRTETLYGCLFFQIPRCQFRLELTRAELFCSPCPHLRN